MKRLNKALTLLRCWGIGGIGKLIGGHIAPRLAHSVLRRFPRLRRIVPRRAPAIPILTPPSGENWLLWSEWNVDAGVRLKVEAARRDAPDAETVIGRVDGDGRVLGLYGDLPSSTPISAAQYAERRRFPLDIMLIGDHVLLRKDFQGQRHRFEHEWQNLALLSGKANVPGLFRADAEHSVLYKALLPYPTLRDLMVERGANILIANTDSDPALAGLTPIQRIEAVWARGRAVIDQCLPADFLPRLEAEMNRIHAAGVAKLSLTFGNIMIDAAGAPWLLDFEGSEAYASTDDLVFRLRRDEDRTIFNRIYGTSLMTEDSARGELAAMDADHWYAPIDFGRGLATHGFWSVDSGTGRWHTLNKYHMPPLEGARILDLGSNNGVMPLMMLRAGARQVIGMELSEDDIVRARLAHRIFEWHDIREYDFTLHHCDMRDMLNVDWGTFDLITSFCTLYYLPEDDMARMVRRAAGLAPIFVVQGNADTRTAAALNKAKKSSVAFLEPLLRDNGFPHVEVIAPRGFSRPMLIGRR